MRANDNQRGLTFPGNAIDLNHGRAGSQHRLRLETLGLQDAFCFTSMRLKETRHTVCHRLQAL